MRIGLFVTCLTDTLFPGTGQAVVAVLERLGHQVVFPAGQACCGQMHRGRQADRQVRPDQAAPAAAERLDGNPRCPRPAGGIVPRLVGPDPGNEAMTSNSKDQILARIRAAAPGPRSLHVLVADPDRGDA